MKTKHRKALPLVVLMLIALSLLPMQVGSADATVAMCQVALTLVGFQEGTATHPGGDTHIWERVAGTTGSVTIASAAD
jgi:hypothetical protein